MKAYWENVFTMLLTVFDLLTENNTIWTLNVPFKKAYDAFKLLISEIQALLVIIEYDRLGLAKAKKQKEDLLIVQALALRNAVLPYANAENDEELKAYFNVSESKLKAMRDTELEPKIRGLHDKANAILLELAPYGIDAPFLAKLITFVDDYKANLTKPRLGITERKSANAQVVEKIKAARNILKGQLDFMVTSYADAQPAFAEGYKNARIIIDLAGGKSEVKEGLLAASEKVTVFDDLNDDDKLKFENKGKTGISFYRLEKPDAELVNHLKVAPGETVLKKGVDLGASGDFLVVVNDDTVNSGAYKVSRD